MKIAHSLSLSTMILALAVACTTQQQPPPASPDSSTGGAVVNVEPATQPDAPTATPPADPAGPVEPAPTPPPTPATPATPPTPPTPPTPAPAEPALPATAGAVCDDKGCAAPYTCVKYYGIAGPRGPEFRSCEIPCADKGATCPGGTSCVTIADGPGRVCRVKAAR